jgi:hypothetical protein
VSKQGVDIVIYLAHTVINTYNDDELMSLLVHILRLVQIHWANEMPRLFIEKDKMSLNMDVYKLFGYLVPIYREIVDKIKSQAEPEWTGQSYFRPDRDL